MAYNGYLVKIAGVTIPNKFIRADTFKCGVNTSDLDSWTDENGLLHRNVLPHTSVKCEWNMPCCRQREMQEMLGLLRSVFGEAPERKATCEVYVPAFDRYVTATMYMPDYQFQLYFVDQNGQIVYRETRFALIEY